MKKLFITCAMLAAVLAIPACSTNSSPTFRDGATVETGPEDLLPSPNTAPSTTTRAPIGDNVIGH